MSHWLQVYYNLLSYCCVIYFSDWNIFKW